MNRLLLSSFITLLLRSLNESSVSLHSTTNQKMYGYRYRGNKMHGQLFTRCLINRAGLTTRTLDLIREMIGQLFGLVGSSAMDS